MRINFQKIYTKPSHFTLTPICAMKHFLFLLAFRLNTSFRLAIIPPNTGLFLRFTKPFNKIFLLLIVFVLKFMKPYLFIITKYKNKIINTYCCKPYLIKTVLFPIIYLKSLDRFILPPAPPKIDQTLICLNPFMTI